MEVVMGENGEKKSVRTLLLCAVCLLGGLLVIRWTTDAAVTLAWTAHCSAVLGWWIGGKAWASYMAVRQSAADAANNLADAVSDAPIGFSGGEGDDE